MSEFNDDPGFLPATKVNDEVAIAAAQKREESRFQSLMVVAKKFPRDEAESFKKVMNACARPRLAQVAEYAYSRGKNEVTGGSVYLAREIARCWGNISYGIQIVSDTETHRHIRAFAIDLETNATSEYDDSFKKMVERNRGGVTIELPANERDLRELTNRRGALAVRNAIFAIIPDDVKDSAIEACRNTSLNSAEKDLERKAAAIKDLTAKFAAIGVSEEQLQKAHGGPLDNITREQYANLKRILRSIIDGNTNKNEHFDFGDAGESSSKAKEVDEALDKEDKKTKKSEKKKQPHEGTVTSVGETKALDSQDYRIAGEGSPFHGMTIKTLVKSKQIESIYREAPDSLEGMTDEDIERLQTVYEQIVVKSNEEVSNT